MLYVARLELRDGRSALVEVPDPAIDVTQKTLGQTEI